MKRVLVVLIAVAVVVAFAGVAMAGIADTKHNLSSVSSNTTKGEIAEICIYCHTPHGGDTSIPLWNRTTGALTVQPYSSSTSSIMGTSLTGVSRACLSCHDGVTSVNTLVNVLGKSYTAAGGVIPDTSLANIGTDLRNDHPVGFSIDAVIAAKPSEYQLPAGGIARLFTGNTVECASCHNVHDNTNVPFLRVANTNSQICLDCHIK